MVPYIADAPLNLIGLQLLQRGSALVTTLRLVVSHLGVTYLVRAHFLIHRQPLPPPLLTAATGRLRGVYRSRGARTAPPHTAAAEQRPEECQNCGGSTGTLSG